MNRKGILVILDGYGEGKASAFNPVKNAKSPTLNKLKQSSYSLIKTDGEAVGLFKGDMGGSEVGHMTIGAGRVIPSDLRRITEGINSNNLKNNPAFKKMLSNLDKTKSNLHLVGMMSDKNVHSNINHALTMVKLAKSKAKHIFLHLITDGRDCGIKFSLKYLKQVLKAVEGYKNVEISSISGRFYAMDRENNIDRTTMAIDAMFNQRDEQLDATKYIKSQHSQGITDEFILPAHIKTKHPDVLKDTDYVCFFNFREDRLRQIVKQTLNLTDNVVTMCEVGDLNTSVLYPSKEVKHTLSEYLSDIGLSQIKISETTKYAHVTYFFNGGREKPFKREDRIHIPTIKTDSYDKYPKMRAPLITKQTLQAIDRQYDAIIINFSNPDMIGHTGNYKAAKKAVEYLDKCLKKIIKKAKDNGYFVMVTADHGNCEVMQNANGEPNTAHTLNKVICAVADTVEYKMKKNGQLKDIAPTFLELLNVAPNKYFEGKSLIVK